MAKPKTTSAPRVVGITAPPTRARLAAIRSLGEAVRRLATEQENPGPGFALAADEIAGAVIELGPMFALRVRGILSADAAANEGA